MNVASFHSMDISHVTCVEYPLVVNDCQKAVEMVGGKSKISQVINSSDKSSNPNYHTTPENTLELKLRSDPFHHPLQSSYNSNEKILIKISIPKSKLPKNYHSKSMLDILRVSQDYKAFPVAIIDKTYSFKSIADFQACTKNNPSIQQIKNLCNSNNFQQLNHQFNQLLELNELKDYQDLNYYNHTANHNLPPPPIFSPIRFPYDYKYQKNPFTTVIKDQVSGEIKVVSTKAKVKLYTKMIDYNINDIPTSIAPELTENLKLLQSSDLPSYSADSSLLKCIEWLKMIFDIKPIWLRKHLDDIVPISLKKSVKQALPYITYIYQSGPWRFCNVKLGINPGIDSKYWIYQSEYFRIPEFGFTPTNDNRKRIKPSTIGQDSDITISESLLFNGITMPTTVTYQIGDLIDSDITTIIKDHQSAFGDSFLRSTPDFQDGWINKQTMEVIRRIIRYKLNRLAKDESIDQNKIYKIIKTDYTGEKVELDPELEANDTGIEIPDLENGDEIDIELNETLQDDDIPMPDSSKIEPQLQKSPMDEDAMDIDIQKQENEIIESLDESTLIENIRKSNIDMANKLAGLIGFFKQDVLDGETDA